MKRKLIITGVVIVLAVVFLSNCRRDRTGGAVQESASVDVREGPLSVAVKGTGNIQAKKSSKIIPKITRRASISYLIPEGSRVASNDVIARLTSDDADRRLSELESAFTECQSKLDAAQAECEIQAMDNAVSLKQAEQALASAKMELEKLKEGDEPLDRRSAELKVQTAESELVRKQKRYEDLKGLLKEGFVTEDEVEEERIAMESAKIALETAKLELQIQGQFSRPLKKMNAEGAVLKTTSELEKTTKQNATRLQTKKQAVELARKAFERSTTDLNLWKKELAAFEVRSVSDGVVTYGDPEEIWRRGEIQVGGDYRPGQVLMTIPEVAVMQAVVNVPEADIFKVQTGMTARVKVEALAETKPVPGKVVYAAEVANPDGWWSTGVKEFKVEISLAEAKGLKPGFSCQAEIITEVIPSCLYLPVQAVFLEDGQYYVYPEGGAGKKTEIKVGRSSVQFVEIVGGLRKGAKVLLNKPAKAGAAQPGAP